ncbi:hydrogenase 2 operon protein HybA [Desulfogranum marinum]|uniref:hydrogenase 2 operon protein HybA n=1 Tax=Desulfogranum marinum TaxID=453220 RepID=UPI001965F4D7|nr:hydrogenase 2 operon protein HybA [Desulfogranum marinum]MBM9512867.1 hydrogenase 2 operon protein HybA [Desulfogranum marinum]
MAINRRDFLKFSAGTGLVLATDAKVSAAREKKELSPDAVGILYDATLCIGCMSCMVNCKKANAEPGGALYHKETAGQIPYEYEGEEQKYDAPTSLSDKTLCLIKAYRGKSEKEEGEGEFSFIKQHCLHCVDPACVSACPVQALKKQPGTGIVTYDKNRCFGCRYCQVACPFGIPMYEWEKSSPSVVKCQLCNHRIAQGGYSACCEACPTGASLFGKVTDLQEEAKRRLNLKAGDTYAYPVNHIEHGKTTEQVVPEYVDHVYGLEEAGGTQYMFLAGVDFDKLGFNPKITNQVYPDLTWEYVSHVPQLIGTLLVAGTVTRLVTQRMEKKNKDNESGE